jgi:predicted permease
MKLASRVYRGLAQAFPHEFKSAFGEEMMQLGEDTMEEVRRKQGAAGLVRLIADIAIRLPIEYFNEIRQDVPYALRSLGKSPGFALVGIVSMGLGIGLTTTVYGRNWALLTRELPAATHAGRLVMAQKPVSKYYIDQFRAQKSLFSGVASLQNGVPFNVGLQGDSDERPERVLGQLVSADYFSVLGVEPQLGRLLSPELDKAGDLPRVVISDRFWRNRLNGNPAAVGQTLRLNGQVATIVGITPKNFDGALSMNPSELFVPITVPAALAPELANGVLEQRNARAFLAIMCLAPGVTIDPAEAVLDGIARRLDALDPSAPSQSDKSRRVILIPAGTRAPIPRNLRRVVEGFFLVLMGLVMTITCTNLATMLLSRGANRRKELAIRLGVGASRFRLIRQMISEGILLSLIGGAAGLALAFGLSVLNKQTQLPAGALPAPDVSLDWRAAAFAFAVAVLCGIGFSVAPAMQATRADLTLALKEGTSLQLPGYRRFGLRNLAVVAQVAGSLILMLITCFLVIGFAKGSSVDTRFDPRTMVLVSIDPVRDGYSPERAQAFFTLLVQRLRTSSSVRSFALAAQPPFAVADPDDGDFELTALDSHVQKLVAKETVGAGYFGALNESVLAGREFTELDEKIQSQPTGAVEADRQTLPLILNESTAREFFGKENALGKRLQKGKQSYEVVGLVQDQKDGIGINQAIVYLPLTQRDFLRPPANGITLLVRSDSRTDSLRAVRSVIAGIDPKLTLFNVQTLSEYLELSRYLVWSAARTYGGIGLFGLILSAIGLAGVTSYAVAQRRKEIGIRMALGASKGQALYLVLREGATLIAIGTILGFLGATAMAKVISSVTKEFADAFQVGASDPRLLVGAPLVLALLAMLACYVPAREAARIDPLKAIRQE